MCQQLLLPLKITDGKKSFWLGYDTQPLFSKDTDPTECVCGGGGIFKLQSNFSKIWKASSWLANRIFGSHPSFRQTILEEFRGRKQRYFLALYISEANLPDYMWPGSERVKRVHVCWGPAFSFFYFAWMYGILYLEILLSTPVNAFTKQIILRALLIDKK